MFKLHLIVIVPWHKRDVSWWLKLTYLHFADCTRDCPTGCWLNTSFCGICNGGQTVSGVVYDGDTGTGLANVKVYQTTNLFKPLTETRVDGQFVLKNQCEESSEYEFKKTGYTLEQECYANSGLNVIVYMMENCKYTFKSMYVTLVRKEQEIEAVISQPQFVSYSPIG